MAEKRAANGATDNHRDNRVPGMARLSQRQLIGTGGFIHADDLFQLARPVAGSVDDQHQRTFLADGLVFIHGQRAIDRQRHFVALFQPDNPGVDHRKTRVKGHGVVSNNGADFTANAGAADDGPWSVILIRQLEIRQRVLFEAVFVNNQIDSGAALAE